MIAGRIVSLAGILLLICPGCQTAGRVSRAARAREDVHLLARWLTGSFSSAEQHAAQPDDYQDIRLHTTAIWTQRPDGPWLYLEQAAATSLDRPYRQRICHLVSIPTGPVECVVYELPGDPLRFAGAGQAPGRFAELAPDQLLLREGCSMMMRRVTDDTFVGGMEGTACQSSLAGAAYATSEASITARRLVTWDRGFDATGQQVWGATKGGYVFKRIAP